MSNLPAHVGPSILPVERRLPQPDEDATALVRLVTDPLNPEDTAKQSVWILNHPHPLANEAKIVRMYSREDGGVEVYSSDGKMFVRTVIPDRVIQFFDEAMSEETFVAFIEEAETEEEEEELPEPEPEPEPEPGSPPGQVAAGEPIATA
jgi:hypothetical protein